ncbi:MULTISPECIES: hypothetical protein [Brevibacillus]|uniref:hypothetical protein n=1 Tax=Brevibacillus TaxID=55080 RepID=UPI00363D83FE
MFAKKSLLSAVATALLLGVSVTGGGISPVFATSVQQSPQQIMRLIGDKYQVGEVLSDKDAELVKKYAFQPNQVKTLADAQPDNWTVTGSNSNTAFNAFMSGTVYVGLNLWENNFRADLTTYVQKGTPTHYQNSIQLEAYGLVGAGGTKIGKTAEFEVSSGWTPSSKLQYSSTFDQPFNASVAYYYITPKGAVKGTAGSIEIVGVGKKK